MWNTSLQIQQAHSHTHTRHTVKRIYSEKMIMLQLYFETGHSARPQSSFISINFCVSGAFVIIIAVFLNIRNASPHCEWAGWFLCLFCYVVGCSYARARAWHKNQHGNLQLFASPFTINFYYMECKSNEKTIAMNAMCTNSFECVTAFYFSHCILHHSSNVHAKLKRMDKRMRMTRIKKKTK